jgi:hypothetical protein
MGLNANHRRVLEVRLQSLERDLLQARWLMRQPPEDGVLVHYRPIPSEVRARIEKLVDRMLAEIAALANRFGFQPKVEDIGNSVSAEMVVAWADLNDMRSSKLRGYGEVDPALAETLDPHIEQLIKLSYVISMAANTGSPATSEAEASDKPIHSSGDNRS